MGLFGMLAAACGRRRAEDVPAVDSELKSMVQALPHRTGGGLSFSSGGNAGRRIYGVVRFDSAEPDAVEAGMREALKGAAAVAQKHDLGDGLNVDIVASGPDAQGEITPSDVITTAIPKVATVAEIRDQLG